MRIYMQTPVTGDENLRFYHLMLQPDLLGGWLLIREWGYQGAPGRTRKTHFSDVGEAQEALLKIRDQQLKRGYRVVFMAGGESHA
jgi:predicted DNA-binding WGR domain protein